MCEKCDNVDRLVAEVNAGTRTFDRDVLRALVLQNQHVLDEMLTDIDSDDKPLHELLSECGTTMKGLGVAGLYNSRMVHHFAHVERDRLVAKASAEEQATKEKQELFEHLVAKHGRSAAVTDASLEVLRTEHAVQHQRVSGCEHEHVGR